jgi:hypothetical protein
MLVLSVLSAYLHYHSHKSYVCVPIVLDGFDDVFDDCFDGFCQIYDITDEYFYMSIYYNIV